VSKNPEETYGLIFAGLCHNIGHSVGWVERSETQQLIGVGFRSSTQPTKNSDGLKYDQTHFAEAGHRPGQPMAVIWNRNVFSI
jgi:hypothetical protein